MITFSRWFGFEKEEGARISKLIFRVIEVPISYHGQSYQEGKKLD